MACAWNWFCGRFKNFEKGRKSLEFWIGACKNWGRRKTKIWEPTRHGVWTPGRWKPVAESSGFRRLRAAASSSGLKGSEVLWPSGVGIFHRSDSCLLTNLVDSLSLVLCAPFFTCCEAMEFVETGHWRKVRPDLPVSLLMVLHALWLECEKSELTASSHRSCFFSPSRNSRDEVALSESVPTGAQVKER